MHYQTLAHSCTKSLFLFRTRALVFFISSVNRDDYVHNRFPNVYKRQSIGSKLISTLAAESLCPYTVASRLKVRMNCMPVPFVFGFVLLIGAVNGNSTFTINEFENNPIAYVEKIGETQIVNGDWNLLVYYDLKNYFDEFNAIRDGVKEIEQKCINASIDCTTLVTQFENRLCGIKKKNWILLNDPGEVRSKRHLFAALGLGGLAVGGGALYNWLTKPEASDYAKAIEDLKGNQDSMMKMIKKQMSVMAMTYKWNKENTTKLEKEQQNLRCTINALARTENDGWQVHNVALQYSMRLENYADTQNRIIGATTNAHNGHLDSTLISPSEMLEQIALIRDHLAAEFELPNTITRIYQMATVKSRLIYDKLIFRVSIPVLRTSPFQMWRIIPIPQTINRVYIEIRPTTEYLLVNDRNETYYDLTEIEFKACVDIDDRLMCRIRHPSYKFGDTAGRCQMDLIRNATLNFTNCQTRPVPLEERWTRLNDIHSWIFVLDKERSYNISCTEFSKTITLKGNGLLYLNGNCSFEGETMQIFTNQLETKMMTGYIVSGNVSVHFNHTAALHDVLMERASDAAMDVETAMQELQKESTQLRGIGIHDVHQYGIIYGFILVVIIYYILRQKKKPTNDAPNFNQILIK